MFEMEKLIIQYNKANHPLAGDLAKDDISFLIEDLLQRVELSVDKLDFSPMSLNILSHALALYYQNRFPKEQGSSQELENLKIIREITAYLEEVFTKNYGGTFTSKSGLLGACVIKEAVAEAVKGGEVRSYKRNVIGVGRLAAGIWEAITLGIERDLSKVYRMLTRKKIKETL